MRTGCLDTGDTAGVAWTPVHWSRRGGGFLATLLDFNDLYDHITFVGTAASVFETLSVVSKFRIKIPRPRSICLGYLTFTDAFTTKMGDMGSFLLPTP